MSSYITSPYVLEQRRLQGIVNQCTANLNKAMEDVRRQQEVMEQQQRDQRCKDQQYFTEREQADEAYRKRTQKETQEQARKRQRLADMLHNLEVELQALRDESEAWKEANRRQERLKYRLEHAEENLEALEQDMKRHMQETEQQVGVQSGAGWMPELGDNGVERALIQQGSRGVSLQIQSPKESEAVREETPLQVFEHKLQLALRSPYSSRFAALKEMKRELDEKPAYARAAFAVHHMKKLDELIRQLEALDKNQQNEQEKRKNLIVQYQAVCKLLEIQPDETLLTDEKSTRMLNKRCSELYAEYQEAQKHKFVADAVSKVMERHGILFQDHSRAEGADRMRFAMENAWVDISGSQGNNLVMEVTGSYTGDAPTLNDRRKSVSAARTLCSLMKTIESELREEYGIVFGQMLAERPSEETIVMERDSRHEEEKRYSGKKLLADTM